MNNENGGLQTWQKGIIILIVIVIIAVIVYALTKSGDNKVNTDTNTNTSTDVLKGTNAVRIGNQFSGGNIVYVETVSLVKPGHVVVMKDNAGSPGSVLGSTYLDAGTRPARVNLSENTVNGASYWVALYDDTDGDKKFDATKDLPLKDASGNIILKQFKALSDLPEFKG